MATAYNSHRKIVESPANATDICPYYCDPIQNPTGNCISICSSICPLNCNTANLFPPSLPSPPPLDDGDVFPIPAKHHHTQLSLPLKISLVILVLTFSLFLLYTLYKFYTVWHLRSRRRRSPSPSPENQETHDGFVDHDIIDHPIWYIRTIGLQPSVISAITIVKYHKTDEIIDGTFCSVCLSDFQENETLRLLPKCNHAFHVSCIDTWLRSHTNCPLCRAGIVRNGINSSTLNENLDNEDTRGVIVNTVNTDEVANDNDENNPNSDLRIGVLDNDVENVAGGSGTNDFLIMRRSVSLNDYAAFRIRNDVFSNNNYYSDRHQVQIRSIDDAGLGFDLIKVEQPPNN
ncbi:RING-H2 finger protein ATL54 [Rutidosis leptorrhynchoides]|uniref:RING-H2 finger protein ATL54 n=1 Tax=Rutidosis leptorrhynchoides TaxID=125765 RepID=UPI003A99652F